MVIYRYKGISKRYTLVKVDFTRVKGFDRLEIILTIKWYAYQHYLYLAKKWTSERLENRKLGKVGIGIV
ncbi:hypothetical protein KPL42_13150 [Clostridium gasigenes]|uniref:hypothetical protein n=1 Tax=Clostridium gasigenes TaxID=94869 RepID=UPI001C0CF228|nr:hypothetical protein [Clostridium gasigenes]MBU3089438.1 hypothetical protein [Clostridium gasigenes]